MTKLLEKAIAQARTLPAEEQDTLAAVLLAMTDESAGIVRLDEEARAAIREGLEQARRGEFVSDSEIEAIWKRFLTREERELRECVRKFHVGTPLSREQLHERDR